MKATYKIKPPNHIRIGDPLYFAQFTGERLSRLTVDEDIPPHLTEARVVLEETLPDDNNEDAFLDMTIYLAPKSTIDTYLKGKVYAAQQSFEKVIGVDSARYIFAVDDEQDLVTTGGDGAWGNYTFLQEPVAHQKVFDAIIIQLGFCSDIDSMDTMRERLMFLFDQVEQIDNVPSYDDHQNGALTEQST